MLILLGFMSSGRGNVVRRKVTLLVFFSLILVLWC